MAGDLSEYDPALDDGGASLPGNDEAVSSEHFATVTFATIVRLTDSASFLGCRFSTVFPSMCHVARHAILRTK